MFQRSRQSSVDELLKFECAKEIPLTPATLSPCSTTNRFVRAKIRHEQQSRMRRQKQKRREVRLLYCGSNCDRVSCSPNKHVRTRWEECARRRAKSESPKRQC